MEIKGKMDVTEEQVRQRAYELWEQRGGGEGHISEYWLQAERELRGEGAEKGLSPNAETNRSGGGSDGR